MIPLIILAIESPEDREYMTALYLEYERLMYWQINKFVKKPWDADDVLQTVLVKLIDKLSELKEKDRNRRVTYILATCRNTAINYNKKRNRIFEFEFQDYDSLEIYGTTPENQLLLKEEYRELLAAWKLLDPKSKYLLEAKYILEKTNKEIAADMDISANSVRTYVARARDKLKSKMKMNARG